jgi:hypothetical protein
LSLQCPLLVQLHACSSARVLKAAARLCDICLSCSHEPHGTKPRGPCQEKWPAASCSTRVASGRALLCSFFCAPCLALPILMAGRARGFTQSPFVLSLPCRRLDHSRTFYECNAAIFLTFKLFFVLGLLKHNGSELDPFGIVITGLSAKNMSKVLRTFEAKKSESRQVLVEYCMVMSPIIS